MRIILPLLLFCFLSNSTFSQDIRISGEKYEQAYIPLDGGTVLTDTANFWKGLEEIVTFSSPKSFFAGSKVFEEIYVGELSPILFNVSDDMSFFTLGLYFGNEEEEVRDVMAHPPGDSLAQAGRVTVLETDSTFTVEFQKITYEIIDFQTGDTSVLDAQFSYQLQFDFKNDKIRYHFGESIISPQGQQKIDELSILSACLVDYEVDEDEYYFQWIFAEMDPDAPDFVAGEGELDDEIPPYHLSSVPEAGTVFEFSFDVVTSSEEATGASEAIIFPNPGGEQLRIRRGQGKFSYAVRDASGRLMTEGEAVSEQRIDANEWPAGMYFVSVETETRSMNKIWIKAE